MKKIVVTAAIALCSLNLFAAGADEVSANSEMMTAWNCGFYPGVVRYADIILSTQSSVFTGKAGVYKGESLYKMGRISDSLECLKEALPFVKENEELLAMNYYWTGRALYDLNKIDEALVFFKKSAAVSKKAFSKNRNSPESRFYGASILWAGKSEKELGNNKDAVSCFEFVLQNGALFSKDEYEETSVFLMESCIKGGLSEKAVVYGEKLEKKSLGNEVKYRILLLKGDALVQEKKYSEAYKNYCTVLAEGPESLAACAMEKAYSVSSEYQAQVREEPGSVILKAQNRLVSYPQLVSEFWTRLAVDAFNSKNYTKSHDYFKNAERDSSQELSQIRALYVTEIDFITSKKEQSEAALQAYNSLKNFEKELCVNPESLYYQAFQCGLSRYSAFCGKWDESLKYSSKVLEKPQSDSIRKNASYWNALALQKQGKYSEALKIIENGKYEDDNFVLIKANCLAKTGKTSEAELLYRKLSEKPESNSNVVLDYYRTLLIEGRYSTILQQPFKVQGAEAEYLKGLAYFNKENWELAKISFTKVLSESEKVNKSLDAKYVNYSRFYLGYSEYQLGEYKEAYSNLYAYTALGASDALLWDACVTAGRSAVQAGKLNEAVLMGLKALESSRTEAQKQDSILVLSGIYSDCGRFDDALNVLKPYTSGRNEFSYLCRYISAKTYIYKNDYVQADNMYRQLADDRNAKGLAEEAAYRRGELYYTIEDWNKAIECFEEYLNQYFGGQFSIAASYFAGDCYIKTGRNEKASLYFEQVVSNPEKSTYRYGAQKNLVELYRQFGDYKGALNMAVKMIDENAEQAGKDGMRQTVQELRSLASGADRITYKNLNDYKNAGGASTKEGRITGTELALTYSEVQSDWDEAEKISFEIIKNLKKEENPEESLLLGKNYTVLGKIHRGQGKNQKSAEEYLEATVGFRKAGMNEEAARSLYSAAEAFDAAGKKGDAKATAETLKQLYPDSIYVKEAEKLIR